jgi:Tetratricopeptide Repeats-Sensor
MAKSNRPQSERVQRALSHLQEATVNPTEALALAKELKSERAFGYARKLLAHAQSYPAAPLDPEKKIQLAQQLALCTYKDPDLSPAIALDDAFRILNQAAPPVATRDQETLGIAGAIYKRKWEHGNHKQHLERSLSYYRRGYLLSKEKGWAEDQGYNAINTAFMLDLLAFQESVEARKAGAVSASAVNRFAEAETIRRELVAALPPLLKEPANKWMAKKWWVLVTIGEALVWLKQAASLDCLTSGQRS